MTLKYEKTVEDVRGKIFFYSNDDNNFGFTETKKDFIRGGHYMKISQSLFLISGRIKYIEKNVENNSEKINIYNAPCIIFVPPKTANLVIALEDSLIIETLLKNETSKIKYSEYRQIVEEKMNSIINPNTFH